MNLKKKLLSGVLSLSFVFGGLFGSVQTFAVGGEDSGSSAVAVDPSVNALDKYGHTPLMNALEEYNVEKVRELLEKGASLEIPSEYWNHYYSCWMVSEILYPYAKNQNKMKGHEVHTNVFEKFCVQVLARYWDDDFNDSRGNFDHTELAPKAREIAEIILKHCAEKGIHLNVNPEAIGLWRIPGVDYTLVFDEGVREIFAKYQKERSDLFTYEGGRELYFKGGRGRIYILHKEHGELVERCLTEELGLPYWFH